VRGNKPVRHCGGVCERKQTSQTLWWCLWEDTHQSDIVTT